MGGTYAFVVVVGCGLGAALHRPARTEAARFTEALPPPSRVLLFSAAALGATAAACGYHWHVLALLWAAACAVPLTLIDLAEHRLPRRLTYPSAAGTLLLLGAARLLGDRTGSPLYALCAAAGLWAVFWVMSFLLPFGGGDATLGLTVGAVLGWYGFRTLFEGVFLGFLLAGLWGAGKLVARRAGRRDELPFGPFLLLGALLAVALSS
ncbi:prepilin peptidase [Streptacidiphilus cavernicola]|uniref:Prepilin peptidase n=1 Tax=Streptacidiphilus cavernicola TaxID=3342716 RepID=A0ABV6VVG9_9ACTN